jgi:hypothetical protein
MHYLVESVGMGLLKGLYVSGLRCHLMALSAALYAGSVVPDVYKGVNCRNGRASEELVRPVR